MVPRNEWALGRNDHTGPVCAPMVPREDGLWEGWTLGIYGPWEWMGLRDGFVLGMYGHVWAPMALGMDRSLAGMGPGHEWASIQ